ncbi:FAD:protein FMN transferase [Alicyclobacillus sp. SO9]|nr:FAD:protein FMN transferase [Alicyclobacillus sp. SO9]
MESSDIINQAMQQAVGVIHAVEQACSRFDRDSELTRLIESPVGTQVPVSPILFQSVHFACEVAKWTNGVFDPTIAATMEQMGFVHHYLTGEAVWSKKSADEEATFRDIELDETNQTICLHRPLHMDLGAVAKGLAVDLAVTELANYSFPGFVVDAGGDVYAAGTSVDGEPWKVDIRHPVHRETTIRSLLVQDSAVCTSGSYERKSPTDSNSHHIVNAHDKRSADSFLSLTAIGPYTMMTDAFSTAAFLYPPQQALHLLEEVGLEGMMIAQDLQIKVTSGLEGNIYE